MGTLLFASERASRPIETCALKPFLAGAARTGHHIVLITSDIISARRHLCQVPATLALAPGVVDSTGTASAKDRWHLLYEEFRPDAVIALDSPEALAASASLECPKVAVNFDPHFAPASTADVTAIASLPELCDAEDANILFLGARLDSEGAAPRWPALQAPKLFAHLEVHPRVPMVLDMLRRLGQSALAAVLDCPIQWLRFNAQPLRIEPHPVDFELAAEHCDIAILHGDPAEVSFFLQHGVPSLLLPITQRQAATARKAGQTGAAVVADINSPTSMVKAWLALQGSSNFRGAAMQLAEKHGRLCSADPFATLSAKAGL